MYIPNFDLLAHWLVWIGSPVCGQMKNCFNEISQIAHTSAPPISHNFSGVFRELSVRVYNFMGFEERYCVHFGPMYV